MSDRKAVPFYGIVSVGNSKDEAINRYKMAAVGKRVSAYIDKARSLSFVTTANSNISELFNPKTGDLDLEESPELIKGLEFESNSSTKGREVNYFKCEAGCGAHVVYDSEDLVKHCPVCTTPVSQSCDDAEDSESDEDDESVDEVEEADDSDAESESSDDLSDDESKDESESESDGDESDDESEDESESDEDESDEMGESESSDESEEDESDESEEDESGESEEDESDESDEMGESESSDESEEDESDESEEDESDESEEDESDESEEDESDESEEDESEEDPNEPVVVAASSKDEAIALYQAERIGVIHASAVEVNYQVCSSAKCGAHVIYESDDLKACPVCASTLVDPDSEEDESNSDLEVMPAEDGGDESESDSTLDTEVDALDNLDDSSEDAPSKLDVVYSSSVAGSPVWTAYYAGTPVAMARKSESKHQDIFDDSSFGRAVLASAKHVGVVNTLREMGFKALSSRVNLDRHVQQQIDQKLAEERAAMASAQKEYQERFKAALATAAVGLTRGFFTGAVNPLKETLFNALSSAGVRNPDVLLHNAFKASSDQYHNVLFAKACEILEKPAEVQEGLAKAVLEMNYVGTAGSSPNPVEERLSSMGMPAHTAASQEQPGEASESSGDSGFGAKVATVVASLGRRLR